MAERLAPAADMHPFLTRIALPSGWQVVYEPVLASTNDVARAAAERGWPDRSVFTCDYQTAGRGRQGRAWAAPPRSSLLTSVLFRKTQASPLYYTMLCSVAAAEAIERLLSLQVAIKWPNDLMLDDRKLAGVLAEAVTTPGGSHVIVGIGLNVNLSAADLAALPGSATALSEAAGRPVHRGELLVLLIEQLDRHLSSPAADRPTVLWHAWHARLWRKHQRVRLSDQGQVVEGVVEGAQMDGALLLRSDDGSLHRIITGEILL